MTSKISIPHTEEKFYYTLGVVLNILTALICPSIAFISKSFPKSRTLHLIQYVVDKATCCKLGQSGISLTRFKFTVHIYLIHRFQVLS